MRFLLFLMFFSFSLINASVCRAESGDITIESDLVDILDSFDSSQKGYNPNSVPKLSDILEATGTLVFFDNSNSTGRKPVIRRSSPSTRSNVLQNTLDRARRRLQESEFNQQRDEQEETGVPVFSDRRRVSAKEFELPETPSAPRIFSYKLDYSGEKTIATIPPDTIIEVPFLKHIPYFFSRIEILSNGMIKVTETIERVIEPKETDFTGIDRYFPKYYTDRAGKKHRTSLTVLESFIDEEPVGTKMIPGINGIRVSLHSKKPQSPGTHVYRITYLFSNRISEFKNDSGEPDAPDFKELIWEVTGTHWDIPVTRAGAVVIFPPDSVVYAPTAITGGKKGYGRNFRIKRDKEDNLSYVLSFPLAPYEGLTISANWSEKDPSYTFQNGKLDRFITEHGTTFVSFIALLFILSYYLATLFSQRKNPEDTPVKAAPLQKGDLTPVVLNYALNKKVTPNSLFIILLGMASKKFLSFGEDANGTMLLIKNTDKETGLTALEKRIASVIFSKDATSFPLTDANALRLKRITDIIEKRLPKEYRKKFTVFPLSFFWFGILMAVVGIVSISSASLFPLITGLSSLAALLLLIPTTLLGEKLHTEIKNGAWKEDRKKIWTSSLAVLPFALCLSALFVWYAIQTSVMTAVFFFATLTCIGVFKVMLRTPSGTGNDLLKNIEGYKLYLSSQDDTLLNVMRNAEAKIKSLYDNHLPFAVALGLERLWTRRFVAFSEKENLLKPDWYKGKLPFDENFVEALAAEFVKVFPQKSSARKSGASSRFKSR